MKIEINLKIICVIIFYLLLKKFHTYIIFFTFVVLHEIAHLLCGIIIGGKPRIMKIEPFGVSLEFYNYGNNNRFSRMLFYAIGPISNFICSLIFFRYSFFTKDINNKIIITNLLLCIFNLLPILPLDGGKILLEIFHMFVSMEIAYEVSLKISKLFLLIISFLYSILLMKIKNLYILILIIYLWYLYYIEEKRFILYMNTKKCLNKWINY